MDQTRNNLNLNDNDCMSECLGKGLIVPTDLVHKLTVNGNTKPYYVFKVKLDLLYYNNENGRIASWIKKYESENGKLSMEDMDAYNDAIQKMIWDSNPDSMVSTKTNIEMIGQQVPGVILPDGRVIDGNRRFTCLRELYKEGKGDEFGYFETTILDGNYGPNDKAIKALELSLQLGAEKPVDYGPIEAMIDIYDNVKRTERFTLEEYTRYANMKTSEAKRLLERAELMVEFLDYIDAKDQYYIAREMKLDGPINEAVSILKKCKSKKEQDRMKTAIFTTFLLEPDQDMTRFVRNLKKIANTDASEDYLDQTEEIAINVLDDLSSSDKGTTLEKIGEIRSDREMQDKICHLTDRAVNKVEIQAARNIPLSLSEAALTNVIDIDRKLIDQLDDEGKAEFLERLDELEAAIARIRDYVKQ